jgi:hypothetical protein
MDTLYTETLTKNENYILAILRDLKPFEQIIIQKDKQGKPNVFLVIRSQKILLGQVEIMGVRG